MNLEPGAPRFHAASMWFSAVAGVGLVIAINLLSLDIAAHDLRDTDGYMRIVRVQELLDGGVGWFESHAPRSNTPFGHSMHWTRPMDIALLALALPLRVLLDPADALYFAGVLVGPLLHILFLLAVYWAARSLLQAGPAALAALLAAVQPVIVSYSAAGRADHHTLILLVATLTIGSAIRLFLADAAAAPRAAVLAGALVALGIWVSTESLLALGAVGLTLAGWWVLQPGADSLRQLGFWAAYTASAIAAVLLERGPAGLSAIEYDRISLPYVVLGALATAASLLIHFTARERVAGRLPRFVWAALFGAVAALALVFLFPGMLRGPFADVPAELRHRWLDQVKELQPLHFEVLTPVDLSFLLLPVLGLLLIAPAIRHAEPRARAAWWLVLILILFGLGATMSGVRFAAYPATFAAFPVALVFDRMLRRVPARPTVLKVIGPIVLTMILAFAWIAAAALPHPRENDRSSMRCSVADAAMAIASAGLRQPVILAGNAHGPEILFRSDARVVSSPYHRNVRGILDALDAFEAEPDQAARIIAARQVDIIAVCPADNHGEFAGASPSSLQRRLAQGQPPGYAVLMTAPTAAGGFLLYRVMFHPDAAHVSRTGTDYNP